VQRDENLIPVDAAFIRRDVGFGQAEIEIVADWFGNNWQILSPDSG
jgi:hypothetical protein